MHFATSTHEDFTSNGLRRLLVHKQENFTGMCIESMHPIDAIDALKRALEHALQRALKRDLKRALRARGYIYYITLVTSLIVLRGV